MEMPYVQVFFDFCLIFCFYFLFNIIVSVATVTRALFLLSLLKFRSSVSREKVHCEMRRAVLREKFVENRASFLFCKQTLSNCSFSLFLYAQAFIFNRISLEIL